MQRANPRIGDDLARVIERLLQKDRGKRVQTAQDLLAELRAIRTSGTWTMSLVRASSDRAAEATGRCAVIEDLSVRAHSKSRS